MDNMATIRNVTELSSAVEDLFQSTGSRWWFRGHQYHQYKLVPKVRRGYEREVERYLFYYFYPRASLRYANCPADDDLAGWLALMQHYGLPTRLLDWSWSPLIAAFFATQDFSSDTSEDACIWALEPALLNESQGFKRIFPPLNAAIVRELLLPARYDAVQEPNRVIAAEPIETDLRMLIQQGAFTVHSSTEELDQLKGSDRWLRKMMIPTEYKAAVAKELHVLGFRLADLFPDLDSLAKEAMQVYRPRP